MYAYEARKLAERANLYGNATRKLNNALREIDFAAKRGEYHVDVAGMDEATAASLHLLGYKVVLKEASGPRYTLDDDGQLERLKTYAEISW